MKTLAICLTTVFVTLKVLNLIPWSWFWIISPIMMYVIFLALLSSIFRAWKDYEAKQEREQNEYRKSKWQQRLDNIRAATEALEQDRPTDTVKAITILIVTCAVLYSCTPSYGIMRCPKQPSYTFKK